MKRIWPVSLVILSFLLIGFGSYHLGVSNNQNQVTNTVTSTQTVTTTVTTTITSTQQIITTIFQMPNRTGTTLPEEVWLTFLGDDTLVKSRSNVGSATVPDQFYKYRRFPYTNFTFNNFTFIYQEGRCEDASQDKIWILPCGSQLSVRVPSGTWVNMLIHSDSLKSQEYFQYTLTGIGVINGELETAELLLVITKDGSRTVYIATNQ